MIGRVLVVLPEVAHQSTWSSLETGFLDSDFVPQFTMIEEAGALPQGSWKEFSAIVIRFGSAERFPDLEKLVDGIPFPHPPLLAICDLPISQRQQDWLIRNRSEVLINPFDAEEFRFKARRICNTKSPGAAGNLRTRLVLRKIAGRNAAFREEIEKIPLIASSDSAALIEGETGTGKELCARAIHRLSHRSEGPFIPINCGAIPSELIENELFGHDREAFTGALTRRKGLIPEAESGTLFFDEVDALPLHAQAKLLRFLQEKEFRPLGSSKPQTANVRVLSASNSNLERLVEKGDFRRDLYYRLNVLKISLPPLRNRVEDIQLLFSLFVRKHAQNRQSHLPALSMASLNALVQYDWPGNARELENVAERALVFAQGGTIEPGHLNLPGNAVGKHDFGSFQEAKTRLVTRFERDYICNLLALHNGNISRAAKSAGKHRRAFWELMRKHQIDPKADPDPEEVSWCA